MKRTLKWIGLVLLVLVVLPVVVAAILVTIYSGDIAKRLVQEAKERYHVEVSVGKITLDVFDNWPHASIQLNSVQVHGDTLGHQFSILAASINLSFNARKLLEKSFEVRQIAIHDASVHVVRTKTEIEGPAQQTNDTGAVKWKLSKINLKNVDLQYDYPAMGRSHGVIAKHVVLHLKKVEEGFSGNADGTWWVKGLTGNRQHGPFLANTSLTGKMGFTWFNEDRTFLLKPCVVKAGLTDVQLAALVIGKGDKRALLRLEAKQAQLNRLKALVNENIRLKINRYTCDKPVDVVATLVLDTDSAAPPKAKVAFQTTQATVTFTTSAESFKACTFKGVLDLSTGDLGLATIRLYPCQLQFKGHAVTADVRIQDLHEPYLKLVASVSLNAAHLAAGEAKKHNLSGTITTDFSFEAPLKNFNTQQPWLPPARLSAEIRSSNLVYSTHQGRFKYQAAGTAKLIGSTLKFNAIQLKSPVGVLEVSGTASQLPEYLSGNKNTTCQVELFAHSALLNLNALFASTGSQKKAVAQKSGNMVVHLQLLADKFVANAFKAERLNASIHFSGDDLTLKNLQMSTCLGSVKAQGLLTDFQKLSLNIESENLDIKELFKEMKDFNQQAITSANISGRLQSQSRISLQLDKTFGIVPGSMNGDVDLHLTDGHLLGFPPLIDLQNAIFPNRNFHDVAFTELSERFTMRGTTIRIHELEVASDLLTFYVAGGVYNLNGPSTINVLIPWSNLKKKKGEMPKLSGKSAEDARGVKINFSGLPGAMKFGFGFKPLD
jgi:hypothetical protein